MEYLLPVNPTFLELESRDVFHPDLLVAREKRQKVVRLKLIRVIAVDAAIETPIVLAEKSCRMAVQQKDQRTTWL